MTALNKQALLIENGQLVADTLRHLADNEIDSDYFAICHTNENGTEIECELAITDYARQAAGTVDELVMALEAAEKQLTSWRSLAKKNIEEHEKAVAALDTARQRTAELSASHSKLREGMAAIYNAICENGASASLSAILTFVKRSREESATAAGIGVKGE